MTQHHPHRIINRPLSAVARRQVSAVLEGQLTAAPAPEAAERHAHLQQVAERITRTLAAVATPRSLAGLARSMRDDYSYPGTLQVVAELVSSAGGDGWLPDPVACREVSRLAHGLTVRERGLVRAAVVGALVTL